MFVSLKQKFAKPFHPKHLREVVKHNLKQILVQDIILDYDIRIGNAKQIWYDAVHIIRGIKNEIVYQSKFHIVFNIDNEAFFRYDLDMFKIFTKTW
eukprot:Pgem_evm1s12513